MVRAPLNWSTWQIENEQFCVRLPNLGEENRKLNYEIQEVRSHRGY